MSFVDTLSGEHALVYETAKRFADHELAPLVKARPHDETLPRTVLPRMAEIGLLGGPFPEEYGGAGIDYLSYALVCEAIGGVSPSLFTSALTVQLSLVSSAFVNFGTEEQKRRFLPPLLRGEKIGAFALTEPDSGSDPAAMKTLARRTEGGWSITGSKFWISNGSIADLILLFAQTEPGSRHRGMIAVVLDGESPGLSRRPIEGKLGLDESNTAALFLEDVQVPDDRVLGSVGEGFRIAQTSLESGRLSTAAAAVGVGQTCLDASIAYAQQRHQWGKPIGGHQLIQEIIADMATEVTAARLLTHQAAADFDAGRSPRLSVAMAKQYAAEVAVRAARNAISLHGGAGYIGEYPVAGLLRDAIGMSLYEGTTQIQKLIIARELLGISAFT
jgi:alkylation response protein AidB-like acyl-CoA dehydrogenase